LSSISFGTLAKVQDSLAQEGYTSRKRKRGADASAEQEEKLQALRERLREIKASKGISTEEKGGKAGGKKPGKDVKPSGQRDEASDDESASSGSDHSDQASDDDEQDTTSRRPKRSSKHAPTSQSSKHAVSRKRAVVPVATRKVRDPRFEPLPGSSHPTSADAATKKNYAFLKDYQASEMGDLRAAIKKTKDESHKETLKRKLLSMESRRKADEAKERQAEVLREHKRKEREAVRQGKQPFFLKRSEVKKQVLVNKFEGMKGKERERAIERRRKKVASRERRGMPGARRGVES